MFRVLMLLSLFGLGALLVQGCLRRSYDVCATGFPHPECPRDAAIDADETTVDAAVDAASEADAAGESAEVGFIDASAD